MEALVDLEIEPEALAAFGIADNVEAKIVELSETCPMVAPVTHHRTPGLYTRQIFLPANSILTSKIHKTEHPYFILKGKVKVWTKEAGVINIKGPHWGITYPGTRRVIFVEEDTDWLTCHPCKDGETLEEIEKRIIEPYVNPILEAYKAVLTND